MKWTILILGTALQFNQGNKTLTLSEDTINQTIVSYYGKAHHGKKTASGEIFNMNDFTCASPTLPFGTKVEITNITTGHSVIVRVNDRGPWKKINGKITPHPIRGFDLSQGAFLKISSIKCGVANVSYNIIKE
jgi:rare lipoprotein A